MAWPAIEAGAALHPAAVFGAAAVSAALTAVAIGYARRRRLLDEPGARRSHTVPTPRGGGIGIVVAVLALGFGPWLASGSTIFVAAAVACALVAAVGWIDDHRPLSARVRFAVHLAAAALVAATMLPADDTAQIAWLVLAALAIAWSINLHNFMDGIDALLAMQAVFVLAALALAQALAGNAAPAHVAGIAAAATLGFLPFNAPRARVFMGDVGSGTLGLLVGACSLWAMRTGALDLPQVLVLSSSFVIDATATLLSRGARGRRWYASHREHLYQWLARSGAGHLRTTGAYLAWNVLVAAPAVVAVSLLGLRGSVYSGVVAAAVYSLGLATWIFWKRRLLRP